jgi:hypothetical protein
MTRCYQGAETRALYYKSILDTTEDSEIKVFAKKFAEEESGMSRS